MLYKCPRCNYTTDKKTNMINHIYMLNLCEHKSFDVLPKEYERYIMLGIDFSVEIIRNKLENKKMKIELDNLRKDIEKLKKENEEPSNKDSSTAITINRYNQPNTSYLTSDNYNDCMLNEKTAYLEMFKMIYQNQMYPENYSVYKTSTKNKIVHYCNGKRWLVGNQDTIIPHIMVVLHNEFIRISTDDRFNKLALLLDTDKKFREKVQNDILIETYNIPGPVNNEK